MNKQINICIGGVRGYTGKALLKLVALHPQLNLASVLARDSNMDTVDVPVYSIEEIIHHQSDIDMLLLATPPKASIEIVTALKDTDINIIDLSGAHRLPQDELSQWYSLTHPQPALLDKAQYGLPPWQTPVGNSKIIANAGCYATCALMSLIPLLKNNVVNTQKIVIDAKSGISGAGKKPNPDLTFCEMSGNFYPYKIGKHQHTPEIKQVLREYSNQDCDLIFVTHMLPIKSGISMSIYADANTQFNSDQDTMQAIENAYQSAYADYPLIKFAQINQSDLASDQFLLSLKHVVGTPNTHIGYYVQQGKVFVFACIDNLLKGAASQAIENINALYDFPLETGLEKVGNLL